jgi:hypothetical protein
MNVRIAVLGMLALVVCSTGFAQNSGLIVGQDTSRRVITTAVPFLTIAPDARSGAMGDAGVAISPDANAIHWNVAKLAFVENDFGFSLAYTPWLAKIIDDMSLSYLSGYYKINKLQAVGLSMRYFDLGEINFTSQTGEPTGDYRPREFQVTGSYSRILTENMGIGVSLKFVHSNLTGNVFSSTSDAQAAVSIGADIGWYWNQDISLFGSPSSIALGATITDIGSKVTYSNEDQKDFIPTNLRIGSALTTSLDPSNTLTLALDFNKLMVPTPPVYQMDENGKIMFDNNGNPIISRGRDPNRPLLNAMFTSFADAPDGFPEEMREIMISTGLEYWYKHLFAARAGYFYEHTTKGNRKYFTMGVGLRYNVFGIDFAYLVPSQQENPLAETLRFTLHFDFKAGKPAAIAPEATN